MFKNRSKTAFVSAVLGTLYVLWLIVNFTQAGTESVGGAVAAALVMPHMICNLIAVIFNWLGFKSNSKGMMITALVFYVIAIILFMIYFLFDLPMVIMSAIAIGKVSALRANNA